MRRSRISRGRSKRSFRHGAAQVHGMNSMQSSRYVMRGGIRI